MVFLVSLAAVSYFIYTVLVKKEVLLLKQSNFAAIKSNENENEYKSDRLFHQAKLSADAVKVNKFFSKSFYWLSVSSGVSVFIVLGLLSYTTVPSGHIKVATLFGKVQPTPYAEGLQFPVNPLLEWNEFDLRQKTYKAEKVGVPSEDKLITKMDVSVQYRTIGSMTPSILRNTGQTADVINVHMVPKLRSILREQGKGVKLAQDFFTEAVQSSLQVSLQAGLSEYLTPQGLQIDSVLIRSVLLPPVIRKAIEETKSREQAVLIQEAELLRFGAEQDKLIKTATSKLAAAELEADAVRVAADAEAYRVKTEYTGRAQGIEKLKPQLSDEYISYLQAQSWNGVLPVYAGGENVPMIDLR